MQAPAIQLLEDTQPDPDIGPELLQLAKGWDEHYQMPQYEIAPSEAAQYAAIQQMHASANYHIPGSDNVPPWTPPALTQPIPPSTPRRPNSQADKENAPPSTVKRGPKASTLSQEALQKAQNSISKVPVKQSFESTILDMSRFVFFILRPTYYVSDFELGGISKQQMSAQ